jgi:cytochrome c peroxidase
MQHRVTFSFATITITRLSTILVLIFTASTLHAERYLTKDDFNLFTEQQAEVGRLLFYDKILSGNRNISCGTCHHPEFGTSDGLSLGIGEGGEGLGPERHAGIGRDRIDRRVPRNAPALWNLGAREITVLMHDGRISKDDVYDNRFNTPAQEWLPQGLNSVLAAQALFPMSSETEMAGGNEENEIGGARNDRIDYAWPIIAKRVRGIPQYAELLVEAFDSIERSDQITIVHIANALAAFIASEEGKDLFFGKATCSSCHSGPLFSSHQFKALALPAFGPGRTRAFDPIARDVGRVAESNLIEDAYRFRVPMLRNVSLTAPYGHNGAFLTLTQVINHHRDPLASRANWAPDTARLPKAPWLDSSDFVILQDRFESERQTAKLDIELPQIDDKDVIALVAFLHSLTGRQAQEKRFYIPATVPSNLPVDRPRSTESR